MSIEGYKLISPVYSRNVVRFPSQRIRSLRVPSMCPHCLQPGDEVKKYQEAYTEGNMRYTVQFGLSTHKKCSGGWTNSNISGSAKVSIDFNGYIRFWFREPLYALIFTSVNFPLLLSEQGESLTKVYDNEISRKILSTTSAKNCPQCRAPLGNVPECPSCHYNFSSAKQDKKKSDESSEDSIADLSIACPKCGILMIKDKKIIECGSCGQVIKH